MGKPWKSFRPAPQPVAASNEPTKPAAWTPPPGLIAVITGGSVRYTVVAECVARVLKPLGTGVRFVAGTCNVAHNRNMAVRALLANPPKLEWLWMLDDDMVFSADCLVRLLAHLRNPAVDIVVPLCLKKLPPHQPTIYDPPSDSSDADIWPTHRLTPDESGLIPVYAAGTGGMLVRRSVFEKLNDPWFVVGQKRPAVLEEDRWFCHRAQEAGIRVWCDLSTTMGHITPAAVWPRHFMKDGAPHRDTGYQLFEIGNEAMGAIEAAAQWGRLDTPALDSIMGAVGRVRDAFVRNELEDSDFMSMLKEALSKATDP